MFAQSPPWIQAKPWSLSSSSGRAVFLPGSISRCRTIITIATLNITIIAKKKVYSNFLTFNSRRAKRMPRQALGPWPNPWKACGFLSIGHGGMRKRVNVTKYHLLLFSSVVQ